MKNITITRGQIGQLGSFIAAIGLLIGLLGFIWQGGLTVYIIGTFVIGLVGLGLWAVMTPDDFVGFFTGRQIRHSTAAVFSTLLLVGIVSLAYIIVQREVIVADMTIDSRFSLSPQTMNVLEAVERSPRNIEILAFYGAQEIVRREIDDQYFQLYESATNGKIQRRYIDPIEEPALASRYANALENGINIFVSFVNEDGMLDLSSTQGIASSDSQERDITEALSRLLAAGSFKVYFERSLDTLDPLDTSQAGMSLLNRYLQNNGLITGALNLDQLALTGEPIPDDASAMILARPRRSLSPAEIDLLDAYLQQGGSLFIGADVFFSDSFFMAEDTLFNDYMWENFGLRMLDAVVVDPVSSGQSQLDIISAAVFGNNEIGINLNLENQPETATSFELARPIDVDEDPPVQNGRVIMTTPLAWGETDWEALAERNDFTNDEDADLQGPLTTVAWAFNEDTGAKIVLVGDGSFMSNGLVQAPQGNTLLFLDSIGWMTGFTEEVQFEPRGYLTSPVLFVGGQALDLIAFITVLLMPGLMLLAAAGIWLRRLRA